MASKDDTPHFRARRTHSPSCRPQTKTTFGMQWLVDAVQGDLVYKENPTFLEALPQEVLENTIHENLLKKTTVARWVPGRTLIPHVLVTEVLGCWAGISWRWIGGGRGVSPRSGSFRGWTRMTSRGTRS
jgi:hypothetical protein